MKRDKTGYENFKPFKLNRRSDGLFAILFSFAVLFSVLSDPAYAGLKLLRENRIVITDVTISKSHEDTQPKSHEVASVIGDIFVQRLEESISKQTSSYFWIKRYPGLSSRPEEDLRRLSESGVSVVIMPELEMTRRGMLFRTRITDLRVGSPDEAIKLSVFETLPIASGADFYEIEKRLEPVTERIARRIVEGRLSIPKPEAQQDPVKRVLAWCVLNRGSDDKRADYISRQLTIELPYYMSKELALHNSEIDLVGLGPKEYFYECREEGKWADEPAYLKSTRYDVVVFGEILDIDSDNARIVFFADDRRRGLTSPLGEQRVNLSQDYRPLAKQLVQSFLEKFGGMTPR